MKKVTALCLICSMLLVLSACSVHNVTKGMEDGEYYDAVISVKGAGEAADEAQEQLTTETDKRTDGGDLSAAGQQLNELREMIGKTDEEAAALYGGGEENWTADRSLLVGRNYEAHLFGTDVCIYTSYDEGGTVGMIFIEVQDGDAEQLCLQIEEVLGGTPEEETVEEGKSWQWQLEDCVITLYEIEGTVSIDLVKAG